MEYTQRLHHFTGTRTWKISPDALSWTTDDGGKGRIPLEAINSVRLRFQPTRAEMGRYAMLIHAGKSNQEFTITNIHYKDPMNFQKKSDEFRSFVNEVHTAVSAKNPETEYLAGSTYGAYAANLALNIFIIGLLAVVAWYIILSGVWALIVVKALIILFYVPTMLFQLKRNFPSRYDPANLPARLIPTSGRLGTLI